MKRFLALVLVASVALVLVPAAAHAQNAFESIGGCFAAQKHVLLTLVMDESASLGDAATGKPGTDPTARRVTAAQVAVDGIADLATQGTRVDVLLTGFSDDLHLYGGWQSLDPKTRAGIESQINGFRTRDTGLDTDFYNAIVGVQRELAKKAATLSNESQPCELVLLFTDGRFDIDTTVKKPYANAGDPKDVKAAKGEAALCAPNGPMQRLRDDGARTITLALSDPAAGAGAADPAFLQKLAKGPCAKAGDQYGDSFDVANTADLVAQFDGIATRLRGATAVNSNCSTPQPLQITPALRGFHVFVDAGSPPTDFVITPPGRSAIRIHPNSTAPKVTGLNLQVTATSNRFIVIEGAPAAGANASAPPWTGNWTMRGGRCQLFVFEAWKAALQPLTLQRGLKATLTFNIVDASGRAVPAAALGSTARVTATLAESGAATESTTLNVKRVGTSYEATVTLPEDFGAQTAVINAILHLQVGATEVSSSPTATEVRVQTPLGFPTIAPEILHLSSVEGVGVSRGILTVTGDPQFAGKACITLVDYPTLPPVAASKLAATNNKCVNVAAHGKIELPFVVDVKAQAFGRVSGRIHLVLTGVNGKTTDSVIPFTFTMTRPVNTSTRNKLFFVLVIGGILFPLLLLWLIARRGAAFELPDGIRATRQRIRVFPDGRLRRLVSDGTSPPFVLDERDFIDAGIPAGRVRSFEWLDLVFESHSSWNPFAPPQGEVSVEHQYVTAVDGVLRGRQRITRGRVPLTLPGVWVFALDPAAERPEEDVNAVDGTVTVFIAAGASFEQQAPRMMRSFTGFFAQLAQRITPNGAPTAPERVVR